MRAKQICVVWLVSVATLFQPRRILGAEQVCSSRQTPEQIEAHVQNLIAGMTIQERIAQLQDRAPAVDRLGLPAYNWWNEGLHGLARDGYATVFPQAIGLAATWDSALLQQVGDVVSTEARAKFNAHGHDQAPRYGGLTIWSPNINIFRDPRWGRGQETYGEDPFLTSRLGVAFVRGIQGSDPFYLKADATPKHFAVHSGPEKNRDSFNSIVSAHDLADTYLRAFHAVASEGKAAAMMCSYNEINGVPSCANDATLKETVREKWGFSGYIVSDCDAVGDISAYHHFAKDDAHAAALALNAGTDLDCGNTYVSLQASYDQKLVTEAAINQALHRLLMARVHLGMLDKLGCSPYDSLAPNEVDSEQHRALAAEAAEKSIVLLRNDGVLPLHEGARVAAIGPTADMLKILEANYHGVARSPITPLDGLIASNFRVKYAQGSLLAEGMPAPVPRSVLSLSDQAAGTGLKGEYFNTPSFSGNPAVVKTVPTVDLDLDRVGPDPRITSNQYAARWQGTLYPPAPGNYVLRVNVERCWDCASHDRFRLFVDGHLDLDNRGRKGDADRIPLHFADTQPHAVRLEYLHTGQDEGVALEWVPPPEALLRQARKTAEDADVIVAFLGLSPDLEGETLQVNLPGFDGGDRTILDLPTTQQKLLTELLTLKKPLVVVLTSGSAVTLGPQLKQPSAVLEAWYPGESGGQAIAKVLSGQANPQGRLPVTFYTSVADLPSFADYGMSHRTYRYFSGPVLYPFGFGLSYTHFSYGPIRLSTKKLSTGQSLTVTATIHNAGARTGTEVSELYLEPPQEPGAPRIMLAGIEHTCLKPGETREISFTLPASQMATANAQGIRSVHSGTYHLYLGSVQPDLGHDTGTAFDVSGTGKAQD